MTACEHKNEQSSIVYINRAATVARKDCRDCGKIISYHTEDIVPEGLKDDIIKFFRRLNLTDELHKLEGRR